MSFEYAEVEVSYGVNDMTPVVFVQANRYILNVIINHDIMTISDILSFLELNTFSFTKHILFFMYPILIGLVCC